MAYAYWPDMTLGAKFGPCAKPCKHTDCAETREMLKRPDFAKCAKCGETIEVGMPFVGTVNRPKHFHCAVGDK